MISQYYNIVCISFYSKGDINIFHASSFHILLQTSFGLQIQIQHVPVMQVYVSLEQSYKSKTRGKFKFIYFWNWSISVIIK